MADYTADAVDAAASIRDAGGPLELIRSGVAAYDRKTMKAVPDATVYPVVGLQTGSKTRRVDDATITVLQFLVAAEGVPDTLPAGHPGPSWCLRAGDTTFQIRSVEPLRPDSATTILYTIEVVR